MFKHLISAMLFLLLLVSCNAKDVSLNTESKTQEASPVNSTAPLQSPSALLHVEETFYEIIQNNSESYTLILKDKKGSIVKKEEFVREPAVTKIDANQYEIIRSVGSPLRYIYVYNSETGQISDTFENPSLIQGDKVVYMKENKLVVSNIYDRNIFYKEITRNFSPTAVPSNVLLKAEFISLTKLSINFLEGKDYIEKTEIIDL